MYRVYKPKLWLILMDLVTILLNIFVVFFFFPVTTKNPFEKYFVPSILFILSWIILSYIFSRYKKLKDQTFFPAVFGLFNTSVISFAIFGGYILIQPASPYSQNVLLTILAGLFVCEYFILFVYFAYRYALLYEVPKVSAEVRQFVQPKSSYPLTEEEFERRKKDIIDFSGRKVFNLLSKKFHLNESSTKILTDFDLEQLRTDEVYKYSTYIQLKRLDNIRGINNMLTVINEKLPDEGHIVCCYKSKSTLKKRIFEEYPKFIAYCIYIAYYLYHRALPSFFLTHRLYYDLTGGKKRMLSKTEILGRLSYCGFNIEKQFKIDNLNFVIAKRIKQAEIIHNRNYGVLIRLKRYGKDRRLFDVYKMRTMYPYAEFLQKYMYEQNNLQEGGKFKKDVRVTARGYYLRKYWLDELPMVFNLIKGDMKLVGVRPLSMQYFNLYSVKLQNERVKFKPGLLPPFYADMPKTLHEIQASEMKYLTECKEKGLLVTDIKYFFLILQNIIFKNVRSN